MSIPFVVLGAILGVDILGVFRKAGKEVFAWDSH